MIPLPPRLDVPALLRRHGLRPDRRLGQNFLADPALLERIVRAAGVTADDVVLEIGPGLGTLTRHLARAAREVIAVELDARLLPALREAIAPCSNVRLIQGDILQFDPVELVGGRDYLVAANIPYNITSAVLRHLLEAAPRPRRIVLTVQQEVAMRVCAGPGEMSLLAVSVQMYGEPQIVERIPAGAFYPAPEVDSAVLRIETRREPLFGPEIREHVFRLARAGFQQKRKTLRNALSGGLGRPPAEVEAALRVAGIDPMRRAETLSLEEWGRLAERLSPGMLSTK